MLEIQLVLERVMVAVVELSQVVAPQEVHMDPFFTQIISVVVVVEVKGERVVDFWSSKLKERLWLMVCCMSNTKLSFTNSF